MKFEGKYKEWYDRLIKANYGEYYAKRKIEKFVEMDGDEFWTERLKGLIEKGDKLNEALKKIEVIRKNITGALIWERNIKMIEFNRKRDLNLLAKAIPKEQLEDGAWYDCEDEAKRVARFQGKAQWIKEKDMFLAPGQQQFGMDGWLDHWVDAIDAGFAGFVPMWKVEEKE
jgi:hypothetical protein